MDTFATQAETFTRRRWGWPPSTKFDKYRTGDTITVRLDLGANTIAFHKNGADVGTQQMIEDGEEEADHYFVFS